MEHLTEEDRRHFDLLGRISALEIMMARVFSDVARLHDDSTAAWMLKNISGVVGSVKDGMPPGAESVSALIEPHLERYLKKALELTKMKNP